MSGVLSLLVGCGGSSFSVSAPSIAVLRPIGTVASGTSTAAATGGAGPYTYAWTTSGVDITYSGTATATLTASKASTAGGVVTGSATVTATDTSNGATRAATISISLENA